MVSSLFKKLKFIDYFGYSAGFKIDGRDNYQTILGGILNIVVFLTFLAHFSINFIKYCKNDDPDIYSVEALEEETDISFKSKDFLFSISLKENKEPIDVKEFFDPFIYYEIPTSNNETKKETIYFKQCNFSDYETKGISNKTFSNKELCPDFNKNETYHIKRINKTSPHYFQFYLKFNSEKTKEAKDLLNRKSITVLSLGVLKNLFTPDNYKEPITNYLDYHDVILSNGKNSFLRMYLGKTSVETKTVNLLDIEWDVNSFGQTKITQDFKITNDSDSNWVFGVYFYPDIFSKIHFRKFAFFDEIIGDAAVVASCVSTFLGFFYSFYSDFKFKSFMFRKLIINYNFNDEPENKDNIDSKNSNNFSAFSKILTKKEGENLKQNLLNNDNNKNINNDNNYNKINIDILKINETEEIIKDSDSINMDLGKNSSQSFHYNESDISRRIAKTKRFDQLASKKAKTKWNYLSYLFSCCKKNKKKYLDIDEVAEKYESKFDIFFYLRRMRNVNLINNVLLNEKQKNVVKMLSKKKSFQSLERNKIKKNDTSTFLENLSELNCADEINKRIFNKFLKLKG